MSVSSRLRAARERQGLTILKLARKSGVTRQTIYTAEDGKSEPDIKTLRKLAAALSVTVADLLDDELETAS